MLAVAVAAARSATGLTLVYLGAGLAGVGLLGALLPAGSLQASAETGDLRAPLVMTLVAIPAYATPMDAMTQVASMFQHGNSVGAAFALLVLGAGANLGTLLWMAVEHGYKKTGLWFAVLIAVVLICAYGVDRPLHPRGVESAGHTHAFDGYCNPYGSEIGDAWYRARTSIRENTTRSQWCGLAVLGAVVATGTVLRWKDASGRLDAWLERPSDVTPRFDIWLPPRVVGACALGGLVAFSVFGCYVYYPPVEEILADLQTVNAEVVTSASTRDWDNALLWIPIYDDWTRKLQVSVVLRGGQLSEEQQALARTLRDKLETLEHEVEDQEVDEAKQVAEEVRVAYRKLRATFP